MHVGCTFKTANASGHVMTAFCEPKKRQTRDKPDAVLVVANSLPLELRSGACRDQYLPITTPSLFAPVETPHRRAILANHLRRMWEGVQRGARKLKG
jgi:hypothetical protein